MFLINTFMSPGGACGLSDADDILEQCITPSCLTEIADKPLWTKSSLIYINQVKVIL